MTDSEIKELAKEISLEHTKNHIKNMEFTSNEKIAIVLGLLVGAGITTMIERSKIRKRLKVLERKVEQNETS